MKPTCYAFIQARMSSTRFPGKVLQSIDGLPSIVYQAQRVARARLLDGYMVITSTDASDDPLEAVLDDHGIPCFRGDLTDVLRRFAAAARHCNAAEIVRLTGDCPLIDPVIIDAVIAARRATATDYASNIAPPSFPDDLDCEVFTRASLERADLEAQQPPEREHVTLWMRDPASGLSRYNIQGIADASGLRLTVDYPDDLEVVREIITALPNRRDFDYYDLLRVLALRPELLKSNNHRRNEALYVPQMPSQ